MQPQQSENIGFYTKALKEFIPKEALKPATYKLIPMSIYATIILICVALIGSLRTDIVFTCLLSIISGVATAFLFTFCHELTHGTIIKKNPNKYRSCLNYLI